MGNKETQEKKMLTEIFCKGIISGAEICFKFVMPNLIMAFILIKFMNQSGLMTLFSDLFAPVMQLFELPGEAAVVILGAWLSMGGAVGVAASLFESGQLSTLDVTVLTPTIFILGSQVQYLGRIVGVIGTVKPKEMIPLFLIPPTLGIIFLAMMSIAFK